MISEAALDILVESMRKIPNDLDYLELRTDVINMVGLDNYLASSARVNKKLQGS